MQFLMLGPPVLSSSPMNINCMSGAYVRYVTARISLKEEREARPGIKSLLEGPGICLVELPVYCLLEGPLPGISGTYTFDQ